MFPFERISEKQYMIKKQSIVDNFEFLFAIQLQSMKLSKSKKFKYNLCQKSLDDFHNA